jgi:hypothetical protein
MGETVVPPVQQNEPAPSSMRQRHERLKIRGSRCFRYHRAAMTVARGRKARRHVVAQESNVGAVNAVAQFQRAAGVAAVL